MSRPNPAGRNERKRSPASGKGSVSRNQQSARSGGLTARFRQHQQTAVDSLLRLLSEPLASFLGTVVIGIALALPLCLLLLLQNLQQISTSLDSTGTLSLYMEKQLSTAELETLAEGIRLREDVASVVVISPQQGLEQFAAASGFSDVLAGLDENPLPPVLLVTPAVIDAEGVGVLRNSLSEVSGVTEAQADLQWLQRLNAIVSFAVRLAVLLGFLLGLGVVFAIGNSVRMAIENRREEIVVVKLVGGTDAYVARPFLYTGFWYGLAGGLIAVLLIVLSIFLLSGPVAQLLGAYQSAFRVEGLGLSSSFMVLLFAAGLGWAGAWLSVLRHLRAIEPR